IQPFGASGSHSQDRYRIESDGSGLLLLACGSRLWELRRSQLEACFLFFFSAQFFWVSALPWFIQPFQRPSVTSHNPHGEPVQSAFTASGETSAMRLEQSWQV